MRRLWILAGLVLAALSAAAPGSAPAAPADLRLPFGERGVENLPFQSARADSRVAVDFATAPDGIYVVEVPKPDSYLCGGYGSPECRSSGRVYVSRYDSSGAWDSSYEAGTVPLALFPEKRYGAAPDARIAVDRVGRAYLVFTHSFVVYVTRLTAGGVPDTAFGVDGTASAVGHDTEEESLWITVLPDGRIMLGGRQRSVGHPWLIRMLSDGTPDPSYGNGYYPGLVDLGKTYYPFEHAVQADGSVIAAGRPFLEGNEATTFIRIDPAGNVDEGFAAAAAQQGHLQSRDSQVTAMAAVDGATVGFGSLGYVSAKGFAFRLAPDGSLDTTFGVDGFTGLPAPAVSAAADAAGRLYGATSEIDALFRLGPNGLPDRTFSGDGWLRLGYTREERLVALLGAHPVLFWGPNLCTGRSCAPAPPALTELEGGASRARCLGRRATIVGTRVADTLRGTRGPDVIAGLGGRDTIYGGGGNDLICGGRGRDRIHGGAGRDRTDEAHR